MSVSQYPTRRLRLSDHIDALLPRIVHETRHVFLGVRRMWTNDGRMVILEAIRKSLVLSRDLIIYYPRLKSYLKQHISEIETGIHSISRLYETDIDVQLTIQLLDMPLIELQGLLLKTEDTNVF